MKLQREAWIVFANARLTWMPTRLTWMPNKGLTLLLAVSSLSLTGCGALSVAVNPRVFFAGPGFISVSRARAPAAAVSVPVSKTQNVLNMAYWQQPGISAESVDICPGRESCEKLFFAGELDQVLQVMDAPSPEAPGASTIRQIRLGKNITDLATSRTEDGGYIFASHEYAGGISVISPGSETVYKFWASPDVPQPNALSVHKRWGFVLSGSTLARFRIDETSADTMDLGGNPMYLSDGLGGVVGVSDFSANLVHLVTTIGVWGDSTVSVPSPAKIVLSQNQNLAFVASVPDTVNGVTPAGSIYVIDTYAGTVVKSIPVGYCISSLKILLQTDSSGFELDPTISDESLIVTNQCSSTFTRIDLSTLAVIGTYPSLGQAHTAAVEP